MDYNDNFKLPPEEVLVKMRVAYQQQGVKIKTQQVEQKNLNKIMFLSKKSIAELNRYTYFIKGVLSQTESFLLKQKCNSLLLLNNKNQKELQELYPNIMVQEVKNASSIVSSNKIKTLLFYENRMLQNLTELVLLENSKNQKVLLLIIKEHLKQVSSLLSQI